MFGYDIFLSEHPEYQELRRLRNEARAAAFYEAARPVRAAIGFTATALGRGFEAVGRWQRERRAINELSALNDRVLADIGLQRRDIRSVVRSLVHDGKLRRTAAEAATLEAAPRLEPRPAPQPAAPRLTAIKGGRRPAPDAAPVVQQPSGAQRAVAGCG